MTDGDAPTAYRNGAVSHWMDAAGANQATRKALTGSVDVDVAIVGAGFTGLWAAYYLTMLQPNLRIAIVEKHHVGYGASGRNGGWLSHLVPGNRGIYSRGPRGSEGAIALQRAMIDSVDEVVTQAELAGVDIAQARGGNLVMATTNAGMQRLRERRSADLRYGLRDDEAVLLDADQARDKVHAEGLVGGLFYPMVRSIQPAQLVTGLAQYLEDEGVVIYENSAVREVSFRTARTLRGALHADKVLIATEGYGGPLLGTRRVAPINSSMIVTDPLTDDEWSRIGWDQRECVSDAAHTFIYAQRTTDGRIAVGGRGAPYRFGSGTGGAGEIPERTVQELAGRLRTYFPGVDLTVAHGWSGVLGVTRDWCATVNFDAASGVGTAYGYAGHGVTSSNLAARTLVDLALGRATDLVRLPLVNHVSPQWEPEPLRWLGVHGMYRLFRAADKWEESRGSVRTSALARVGSRLAGLHD